MELENVCVGIGRCKWASSCVEYHDKEWAVPVHDDRVLFEQLCLESMSCGLSWAIILRKRDVIRKCFDDFNYHAIARYDQRKINEIMACPQMIRSAGKIAGIINNARIYIRMIEKFGSFDAFIWSYTGNKTYVYSSHSEYPVTSNEISENVSRDLKKHGFKYVGPVIIYSYLQAIGVINDHEQNCFRYNELLTNNCEIIPASRK